MLRLKSGDAVGEFAAIIKRFVKLGKCQKVSILLKTYKKSFGSAFDYFQLPSKNLANTCFVPDLLDSLIAFSP